MPTGGGGIGGEELGATLQASAPLALQASGSLSLGAPKPLAGSAPLALQSSGALQPGNTQDLGAAATMRVLASGALSGRTGLSATSALGLRAIATLEVNQRGSTPRIRVIGELEGTTMVDKALGGMVRVDASLVQRIGDVARLLVSLSPNTSVVDLSGASTLRLISSGVLPNSPTHLVSTGSHFVLLASGSLAVTASGSGGSGGTGGTMGDGTGTLNPGQEEGG